MKHNLKRKNFFYCNEWETIKKTICKKGAVQKNIANVNFICMPQGNFRVLKVKDF